MMFFAGVVWGLVLAVIFTALWDSFAADLKARIRREAALAVLARQNSEETK